MALKDNIWWTRKARIQAEKRLLSNAFQSNLLLLWYSFSGVAASIYYLFLNQSPNNNLSGISWVIYSVLVLCISGFINGLSFRKRAGLIKECYETLNGLYAIANTSDFNEGELSDKYEQILGVCENHTDVDYYRALCVAYLTNRTSKVNKGEESKLDRLPTTFIWLVVTWSTLKRSAMLLFLYLLPILLFALLKYGTNG